MNRSDFEIRVLPQLDALYRAATILLDNESDAQDLIQESFCRAYQDRDVFHDSPKPRVWLFKIMADILINKYWIPQTASIELNDVDEVEWYLQDSWRTDCPAFNESGKFSLSVIRTDHIKKAVQDLPQDLRLLVALSLLESFAYKEIAEIAGLNLETARSRLGQGRELLQRKIFDYVGCRVKNNAPAVRARRISSR